MSASKTHADPTGISDKHQEPTSRIIKRKNLANEEDEMEKILLETLNEDSAADNDCFSEPSQERSVACTLDQNGDDDKCTPSSEEKYSTDSVRPKKDDDSKSRGAEATDKKSVSNLLNPNGISGNLQSANEESNTKETSLARKDHLLQNGTSSEHSESNEPAVLETVAKPKKQAPAKTHPKKKPKTAENSQSDVEVLKRMGRSRKDVGTVQASNKSEPVASAEPKISGKPLVILEEPKVNAATDVSSTEPAISTEPTISMEPVPESVPPNQPVVANVVKPNKKLTVKKEARKKPKTTDNVQSDVEASKRMGRSRKDIGTTQAPNKSEPVASTEPVISEKPIIPAEPKVVAGTDVSQTKSALSTEAGLPTESVPPNEPVANVENNKAPEVLVDQIESKKTADKPSKQALAKKNPKKKLKTAENPHTNVEVPDRVTCSSKDVGAMKTPDQSEPVASAEPEISGEPVVLDEPKVVEETEVSPIEPGISTKPVVPTEPVGANQPVKNIVDLNKESEISECEILETETKKTIDKPNKQAPTRKLVKKKPKTVENSQSDVEVLKWVSRSRKDAEAVQNPDQSEPVTSAEHEISGEPPVLTEPKVVQETDVSPKEFAVSTEQVVPTEPVLSNQPVKNVQPAKDPEISVDEILETENNKTIDKPSKQAPTKKYVKKQPKTGENPQSDVEVSQRTSRSRKDAGLEQIPDQSGSVGSKAGTEISGETLVPTEPNAVAETNVTLTESAFSAEPLVPSESVPSNQPAQNIETNNEPDATVAKNLEIESKKTFKTIDKPRGHALMAVINSLVEKSAQNGASIVEEEPEPKESRKQSRYGRAQKQRSLGPDMHITPLIRQASETTRSPKDTPIKNELNKSVSYPKSVKSEAVSKVILPVIDRQFEPGDMLWSAIPGHPWWPCIVSNEPLKNIYIKHIQHKKSTGGDVYHVQYFGKGSQHGWTILKGIMEFKGGQQFKDYVRERTEQATGRDKLLLEARFQIVTSRLATWNEAVSEANDFLRIPKERRLGALDKLGKLATSEKKSTPKKTPPPTPPVRITTAIIPQNEVDILNASLTLSSQNLTINLDLPQSLIDSPEFGTMVKNKKTYQKVASFSNPRTFNESTDQTNTPPNEQKDDPNLVPKSSEVEPINVLGVAKKKISLKKRKLSTDPSGKTPGKATDVVRPQNIKEIHPIKIEKTITVEDDDDEIQVLYTSSESFKENVGVIQRSFLKRAKLEEEGPLLPIKKSSRTDMPIKNTDLKHPRSKIEAFQLYLKTHLEPTLKYYPAFVKDEAEALLLIRFENLPDDEMNVYYYLDPDKEAVSSIPAPFGKKSVTSSKRLKLSDGKDSLPVAQTSERPDFLPRSKITKKTSKPKPLSKKLKSDTVSLETSQSAGSLTQQSVPLNETGLQEETKKQPKQTTKKAKSISSGLSISMEAVPASEAGSPTKRTILDESYKKSTKKITKKMKDVPVNSHNQGLSPSVEAGPLAKKSKIDIKESAGLATKLESAINSSPDMEKETKAKLESAASPGQTKARKSVPSPSKVSGTVPDVSAEISPKMRTPIKQAPNKRILSLSTKKRKLAVAQELEAKQMKNDSDRGSAASLGGESSAEEIVSDRGSKISTPSHTDDGIRISDEDWSNAESGTESLDIIPIIPSSKKIDSSPAKKKFLSPGGVKSSEVDTEEEKTDSGESEVSSTVRERLCQLCEVTGNVVMCKGPCQQTFHLGCMGLTDDEKEIICDPCRTGVHSCFLCKSKDDDVKKCSVSNCGKFYHQTCLKDNPVSILTETRSICPLHTCLSCYNDNPKDAKNRKGRMLRCVRCPSAYHHLESCIAAGSLQLSNTHILCAHHFQPRKGNTYHTHLNTPWCMLCSEGGQLICCESCPASFHAECLGIQAPEGSYFCAECKLRNHPRYGDIVWVKLGCYRWWPAKIITPNKAPLNIQRIPHGVGEFPVRFYGSHDYFWVHKGRVFLFQEGDKGGVTSGKYLMKVFKQAMEEVVTAYQEWKKTKTMIEAERFDSKPAQFKLIKSNRPFGKVQTIPLNPTQINGCECTEENPCGYSSACLNRILHFECHPNFCPVSEICENQVFQRRTYPKAGIKKVEGRGFGLFALESVAKGRFVSEYVGELIDEEECEKRLKLMHLENDTNYYFLTIEKDRIIDARPKGNLSRFMNHSCQPNCETQKWFVNGETRIGLFSLCDIPEGDELTFNYNLECRGNEKTKCTCGADNCSGFIGVRPKTAIAIEQEKRAKEKLMKPKKRRKSEARKHEDECFRCGEGGELLMCDRSQCPKSYHLSCLGLVKPPHTRWDCPWHHCDVCGRHSIALCESCPNSFCKAHLSDETIRKLENGAWFCEEERMEKLEEEETEKST